MATVHQGQLGDLTTRSLPRLGLGISAVIRIDDIWLATEPLDMRAGWDEALARVVQVVGCARLQ